MTGPPVSVVLPDDLAELLTAEGAAQAGGTTKRSPLVELLVGAPVTVAGVITLLQGPPTVGQLAHYLKHWLDKRRRDRREVATLIIKGPRGELHFEIRPDTDLTWLATELQPLLFGTHQAELPPPDGLIDGFVP